MARLELQIQEYSTEIEIHKLLLKNVCKNGDCKMCRVKDVSKCVKLHPDVKTKKYTIAFDKIPMHKVQNTIDVSFH